MVGNIYNIACYESDQESIYGIVNVAPPPLIGGTLEDGWRCFKDGGLLKGFTVQMHGVVDSADRVELPWR